MTPNLTEISWTTQSSIQVYNLFRSLYSYKELTTQFKNLPVKIVELRLGEKVDSESVHVPGTVEYVKSRKALCVYCAEQGIVEVLRLKVDGKKVMSAADFNNGFLKKCCKEERLFINVDGVKSC